MHKMSSFKRGTSTLHYTLWSTWHKVLCAVDAQYLPFFQSQKLFPVPLFTIPVSYKSVVGHTVWNSFSPECCKEHSGTDSKSICKPLNCSIAFLLWCVVKIPNTPVYERSSCTSVCCWFLYRLLLQEWEKSRMTQRMLHLTISSRGPGSEKPVNGDDRQWKCLKTLTVNIGHSDMAESG